MNNTRSIRFTAAAGTNLARAFPKINFTIIFLENKFTNALTIFFFNGGLLDHP